MVAGEHVAGTLVYRVKVQIPGSVRQQMESLRGAGGGTYGRRSPLGTAIGAGASQLPGGGQMNRLTQILFSSGFLRLAGVLALVGSALAFIVQSFVSTYAGGQVGKTLVDTLKQINQGMADSLLGIDKDVWLTPIRNNVAAFKAILAGQRVLVQATGRLGPALDAQLRASFDIGTILDQLAAGLTIGSALQATTQDLDALSIALNQASGGPDSGLISLQIAASGAANTLVGGAINLAESAVGAAMALLGIKGPVADSLAALKALQEAPSIHLLPSVLADIHDSGIKIPATFGDAASNARTLGGELANAAEAAKRFREFLDAASARVPGRRDPNIWNTSGGSPYDFILDEPPNRQVTQPSNAPTPWGSNGW